MIGRVGDDDAGRAMRAGLRSDGVDVSHVATDPAAHTGLAVITLDAAGENSIVVSPGANSRLAVGDVAAARGVLGDAAVTLVQLEIPLDAVEAAAATATGIVILNPAPAQPLPEHLLQSVDLLVPNRSELGLLAGVAEPTTIENVIDAVDALPWSGDVVVTLGSEGALVVVDRAATHVSAPVIDAVDTTAAGDAFCGALADALARGELLPDAVAWAAHAGAVAATGLGAQPSLPTRDQVIALQRK
jgi:ribokinase